MLELTFFSSIQSDFSPPTTSSPNDNSLPFSIPLLLLDELPQHPSSSLLLLPQIPPVFSPHLQTGQQFPQGARENSINSFRIIFNCGRE